MLTSAAPLETTAVAVARALPQFVTIYITLEFGGTQYFTSMPRLVMAATESKTTTTCTEVIAEPNPFIFTYRICPIEFKPL